MGFFSGNRKNQPSMSTEKTLQRIGIAGTAHHTGTTHLAINIARGGKINEIYNEPIKGNGTLPVSQTA